MPTIDWQRPWFAPYRSRGPRVCARIAAGGSVAEALNAELDARPIRLAAGPLRFVPTSAQPTGEAYEAFIARTAGVPTRDDLHDLFNGLVWLAFPAWKRRLNALQAAAIGRHGVGGRRGALRDALTLLDESGALLDAPTPLWARLRRRDWAGLFVHRRVRWQHEARLTLIGHALLEKLARGPYKALTAQAWRWPDPTSLTPPRLATKPFAPLPLLGVPGWWPANEAPAFYDDAAVFRPRPPQASVGRKPSIDR